MAPPPIPVAKGARTRLRASPVEIGARVLERLREACPVVEEGEEARLGASRDWWPLSLHWARRGFVPALPGAVARPADTAQVAGLVAICADHGVPVTVVAGRSGVCGGAVPAFGGLALDLVGLAGVEEVDDRSLLVQVAAGTFGLDLEETMRIRYGLTLGHWPRSVQLSTVGGWLACRSAGQYSTRYGKIEDMVMGLEVVLASGQVVETGGRAPRAATGPDLNQVFVGSEGTLGVITGAWLRAHPQPAAEGRAAWGFAAFDAGLEACRRVLRRGATPAVLRLYDQAEASRHFGAEEGSVLIALDEGDGLVVKATLAVLAEECRAARGRPLGEDLVGRWLETRNDVSPLAGLAEAGVVVDTVEVAGRWSVLPGLYHRGLEALTSVDGTVVASAHLSHAYLDGACLYFTFAGQGGDDLRWVEGYYRQAWDAIMGATLSSGGAISHHHGIGMNRGRFLGAGLGPALSVLGKLKEALDPAGILNPGKLGLPSRFGPSPWP
jgi:alkyldihydroxyacetonephosphate synthase